MVTVSVIIPTSNRAQIVSRAILSVLSQTYRDFELIIVDDASKDRTKEIVKEFTDPRIRYVRHFKKKGAGAARNTGIQIAKQESEYIAFLDDDDEWLPTKLFKQVNMMRRSSESVGAIYTGVRKFNEEKKLVRVWVPIYQGYIYDKLLEKNCVGSTSAVLVRREVLDEVGGFDEKLPACLDWDMWLRIAKHYEFMYIPEILLNYYQMKRSISRNIKKKLLAYRIFFPKYKEYLSSKKLRSLRYLRIGKALYLNGSMSYGRNYISRAFLDDWKNLDCILQVFIGLFGYSVYNKLYLLTRDTRLLNVLRDRILNY